jgi:hypothetical protein
LQTAGLRHVERVPWGAQVCGPAAGRGDFCRGSATGAVHASVECLDHSHIGHLTDLRRDLHIALQAHMSTLQESLEGIHLCGSRSFLKNREAHMRARLENVISWGCVLQYLKRDACTRYTMQSHHCESWWIETTTEHFASSIEFIFDDKLDALKGIRCCCSADN